MRVSGFCERHHLLRPGEPVLAMVSGGPDSTLLMHALVAAHDGPVGVLSIDHGLRPEAAAECERVAASARALGARAHVVRLSLAAGAGMQARARDARRAAAAEVADAHGYGRIALGHTSSDQAETVLFRLARGAGRTGALGMAPGTGRWIRPLLGLTAGEVRAWCAARSLQVEDDPTNRDRAHGRVIVRHEVLPALEAAHGGAEDNIAAFADLLRDEAALLEPLVDEAVDRVREGDGLAAARLLAEPAPLARLVVRRWLAGAGQPPSAGARGAVERVLDVARDGSATDLPGGGAVACAGGVLRARTATPAGPGPGHAAPPAPEGPHRLEVPGAVAVGSVVIRSERGPGCPPAPERVALACGEGLAVRETRAGDRLALAGGGHRAVARLLADAGVAPDARRRAPVVVCGERVLWVVGHRAAADALAPEGAPSIVLQMERVA